MNDKTRKIGIVIAAILGLIALFYVGGLMGQLLGNYQKWMVAGGMTGGVQIQGPNVNPIVCFRSAFSLNGLKGMGIAIAAVAGLILYIRLSGQNSSKGQDERGFTVSNTGTYGTAGWMSSKDMKERHHQFSVCVLRNQSAEGDHHTGSNSIRFLCQQTESGQPGSDEDHG